MCAMLCIRSDVLSATFSSNTSELMQFDELMTDAAVLAELGHRLERHRLERNWTQAELAAEAGIGQATVQRAERGESVQMTSMIKLLRTLGLLGGLDVAVPESIDLPIAQLEREQRRAGGAPAVARGASGSRPASRPRVRPPSSHGRGATSRARRADDRRGGDALGDADRGGVDRRGCTLRDVPVRPGVRRAAASRSHPCGCRCATQPYSFPGLPAGCVQRSPRLAGRLAARPLGDGARQRLAGLAGARAVELRCRSTALLRRHPRGRRVGVPAGPRADRPRRRGPPGRRARASRQRGARRNARSSWPS